MQGVWVMVLGTAVGFTIAGLLTSLYDILTERRLSFAMAGHASTPELLLGMFLRVVAGPFLLVRSAWEALQEEAAGPLLIAVIVAIAFMWSCFSGVVIIDLLSGLVPGQPQ